MKLWLVVLLGIVVSINGEAQSAEMNPTQIVQDLRALKNGVLVVRLESNRKKIEALARIAVQDDLTEARRNRVITELEATRDETNEKINAYRTAFKDYYDFSEVVFMFDYETPDFKKKQMNFTDVNGERVSGKEVFSRHHLILSTGQSDVNSARVLEFLSSEFVPMGRPAPKSHFGLFAFMTPLGQRIVRLTNKMYRAIGENVKRKYVPPTE